MSKKIHDMVAEIAADLGSPRIVAAIDKALAALVDLRKVAGALQGETAPLPLAASASVVEASPKPQIYQKNENQGFDGRVRSLVDRYSADRSEEHTSELQ